MFSKYNKNLKSQQVKKAKEIDRRIHEIIESENNKSKTDPLGSYTGVASDKYEKTVQDADDL